MQKIFEQDSDIHFYSIYWANDREKCQAEVSGEML